MPTTPRPLPPPTPTTFPASKTNTDNTTAGNTTGDSNSSASTPTPPPQRQFSGDLRQSSNSTDFNWIHGGDGRSNNSSNTVQKDLSFSIFNTIPSNDSAPTLDNDTFQAFLSSTTIKMLSLSCLLCIVAPILAALTLVVLRNTFYVNETMWYTEESLTGITTPMVFGGLVLFMSMPYFCLFKYWIQHPCMRALFWSVHILLVALPTSMLVPLRNGFFSTELATIQLWTAVL